MSIILPPIGHPARELIDVKHLAEVFAPHNLHNIENGIALFNARKRIKESDGAIIDINVICEIGKEYRLLKVSLTDVESIWNFTKDSEW
jgi:hypothetical protein